MRSTPARVRTLSGFLVSLLLAVSLQAAVHAPLPLGSPLPAFSLSGVNGHTYTPGDFKAARLLVIVFTCNHCPTAQAYESRIKQLVADYGPRGVAFLAVNPNHAASVRLDEMGFTDLDDSFVAMKERAINHAFNFPYVDDGPTESFSEKLGPAATPHVFIFDQGRTLRYEGRIDNSERKPFVTQHTTRDALDALLAGREPGLTRTKVFGCSIKWKEKAGDTRRWMEKVSLEPVSVGSATADTLKALRTNVGSGKVRMIHVWATWCGPCVSEFDEVVETNLRFRNRDFELITVAAQFPDERPKVLPFLEKHHASMRNLIFGMNDKYALMDAIDPEWNGALPYTLVVGPKGEVLYRCAGPIDFLELRRALVPALNAVTAWPGMNG